MPIRFRCSECGRTITVPDKAAGRQGRCPSCKASQAVPDESTTSTGGGTGLITGTGTGVKKRRRGATANIDVNEIVPGEDDSDDELEPVEMDDDIRSLLDSDDDVAEVASTGRRGRKDVAKVAMTAKEKRQQEKQAYRDALDKMKQQQKGGRTFLFVVFSLVLIPTFTAAAALLGAFVTLNYAEDPKAYAWFETPASWFGLDEKARNLNTRRAHDGDDDDTDPAETGDGGD